MKGSNISNVRLNPAKQKIVHCSACGREGVVGKYAKNDWKCDTCVNIPKGQETVQAKVPAVIKPEPVPVQTPAAHPTFGAKLTQTADKLGFELDGRRVYRKKYAVDGGGIATVHVMVEQGVAGQDPQLEYFSLVVQRAVGVNEDFRKFMPPDAASDCELLVAELGVPVVRRPQIGQEKCDSCGAMTDEFGVDQKRGRILCIKPNACFRKQFTSAGAEAEL